MAARRMHVVLAEDLVSEIDHLVGKRLRSEFLAEAASRELLRQKQLRALQQATGAWARTARAWPSGGSALLRSQDARGKRGAPEAAQRTSVNVLVDTSVLIDVLRNRLGRAALLATLRPPRVTALCL